ncbi:MAG TPA: heparan-alpha-glucosaminide N-acetyltransferase [Bacillota bacterium]|nr:heparan-alpha-glucosaminide N-acetyltransferase [Bacillota bacterium]
MKERIWELDALRGLSILCVVAIHLGFDLMLFGLVDFSWSPLMLFVKEYGGAIFVILSGICITLGRGNLKRASVVVICALLLTAATYALSLMGLIDDSLVIRFGVLHLLGSCMLLYHVYKRLPLKAMGFAAIVIIVAGYVLEGMYFPIRGLFFLGIVDKSFASGDFFPLLPHLGWFMLGNVLGVTVYKDKKTLFPKVDTKALPIRLLSFCGRASLPIYLLHQPLFFGLIYLIKG